MPRVTTDLDRLATPALLLDLDVLESNLDRIQSRANRMGVTLRPHAKTHKCLEIADLQRTRGAQGLTVSTLEEARAFADHGFDDLTWAFPLIPSRLDEVGALCERVRFGVTVDSNEAIDALERAGIRTPTWVKVDCGYGRAGVDPASAHALEIVRRVSTTPGLELAGLLSHSGHAYRPEADAADIAEQERATMTAFAGRLRGSGIEAGRLSVGSTPAFTRARSLEGVDEVRPGNYALFDHTQVTLGSCDVSDCAATVLATVVSSVPGADHCVTDTGALAMSKDMGTDATNFGYALADVDGGELDRTTYLRSLSQEHGILVPPRPVGSKIRILPHHSCLTVAMFDHFVVVRGTSVTGRWKIWRGR